MRAVDARLISSALEEVARTPEANVRPESGHVGGEPTLASWLFEIRRDVLSLPWFTGAAAESRRAEIVAQLTAAIDAAPAQADQIRPILDRFKKETA